MVNADHHITASCVGGVGVEDLVLVLTKYTDTMDIFHLRLDGPKIVCNFAGFQFVGRERDMIVVVEIAPG